MDRDIEQAFLKNIRESVGSVLNIMAGIEIKEDALLSVHKEIQGDITGIIGLSNNDIKGTMSVIFPEELGRLIVANMLGIEPEDISDEDLKDGVGEIINMVAGDFNNRMGSMFKLSLPSVIKGKKHSVSLAHNDKPIIYKLFVQDNYFYLLSIFKEQNR